jgi:hypothetical protein
MEALPVRNAMRRDLFRWRSAVLLTLVLSLVLLAFQSSRAALGAVIGFGLYAANLFLIAEIARGLTREGGPIARRMVAVSAVGRLLLLTVALAALGLSWGREMLLGACGGLLLAQINLHVVGAREGQEKR